MDSELLRTLIVLSETLHFGMAARKLRIAQPHVSRRIRQLEEMLDIVLFERTNRNVKLTEAGEVYVREARELLKSVDLARRKARDVALGRSGKLYVSVVNPAMLGAVTQILADFHRNYADVQLSISEHIAPTESHLEILRDGLVDIIFSHPPQQLPEGIESIRLVNDPMCAVLSKDHRLANRERLSLTELAQEPWVMIPRRDDPGIFDRFMDLCRQAGFTPNIKQEAGAVQIRCGLVAAGFGVQLLRNSWRLNPYPGVVYIPVEPSICVEIFGYWDKRNGKRNVTLRHLTEIAAKYQI